MAIIRRKIESYTEYPDGSWEVIFGEFEEVLEFEWPDELPEEPYTEAEDVN